MLPRADLNGARPAAPVEPPTPAVSATDARQEVQQRLARIAIGSRLQGEVLSLLKDGGFLVKVTDSAVRMMLPAGTRAGDQLSLMFLASTPRPTFLLLPPQGSVTTSLSNAGRLIDQLLQSARQDKGFSTLTSTAPLLPSSDLDTGTLASALHETFEFSGLFYESHLEQWVSGERPLAQVLREPQTRPAPTEQGDFQHLPQTGTKLPRQPAHGMPLADAVTHTADVTATMQQANAAADMDADVLLQAPASLPEMDPAAARLINLQLDVLEQRRVHWQGEVWPGQSMEWEISEDTPQKPPLHEEPLSSWTSVVRFRLPSLGEISAFVRLTGDRVQVQVSTPHDTVAAKLQTHAPLLADALAAAGSPLDGLLVKVHDR